MKKSKKPNKKLRPLSVQHGALRTRRDLLSHGFITMGATIAAPSILSLVSRVAYGAECVAAQEARMMPFICIDLGGGANLSGANVIVGGPSGQKDFLPDGAYGSLGLTPEIGPKNAALNEEFGLAMHPESRILAGLLAATSAATRAKVDGGVFCTVSSDDTSNNPHSPLYWLAKAGLQGEIVGLVGTTDNISGGRAEAPSSSIDPRFSPAQVRSARDAISLVTAGKIGEILGPKGVQKVITASQRMSESALSRFNLQTYADQLKDVVGCAYTNAEAQLTKYTAEKVDPGQDPMASTIFNLDNGDENKAAAISKLILDDMAGGGCIQLGGFDYHNNPRTTTDPRDLNAGTIIGKILEFANQKQKNLMIYCFTDGGISCRQEAGNIDEASLRYNPSSDSGTRSCAFTLVHRGGGEAQKPELNIAGRQVGAYQSSGIVDSRHNLISNSVENLTKAIVANYLALHGREGDLATIVGDNPFGGDLEKYLLFKKIQG